MDKNSPDYFRRQVTGGRAALLMVIIFTLVNLVMLILNSGRYFLFSASLPYYLTFFGLVSDNLNYISGSLNIGSNTVTALVISAVILVFYLLCWLLGKKRPGWYIAAVVLFVLDTAFLVWANMDALGESIVDLVFHGWVILQLVQAAVYARKLAALPAEEPAAAVPEVAVPEVEIPEV